MIKGLFQTWGCTIYIVTLFRRKADPKWEGTGTDPTLQRELRGLMLLGGVCSSTQGSV